ncbi:MAG: hypothetical protein EBT51_05325 [Flavobacteriaceae bacterium]|jgi:hypothetical protein|nr:hypothetical protein [Flavobacteriaceae bacterium]
MTIICGNCKYYFVTHDKNRPWGCNKFGFKSNTIPCQEVKNASGTDCAYYEKKSFKKTREINKHAGKII